MPLKKARFQRNMVSINSTSEEVRSSGRDLELGSRLWLFPLIQLPRKSEALLFGPLGPYLKVSINSTSEEVRRLPINAAQAEQIFSFH